MYLINILFLSRFGTSLGLFHYLPVPFSFFTLTAHLSIMFEGIMGIVITMYLLQEAKNKKHKIMRAESSRDSLPLTNEDVEQITPASRTSFLPLTRTSTTASTAAPASSSASVPSSSIAVYRRSPRLHNINHNDIDV